MDPEGGIARGVLRPGFYCTVTAITRARGRSPGWGPALPGRRAQAWAGAACGPGAAATGATFATAVQHRLQHLAPSSRLRSGEHAAGAAPPAARSGPREYCEPARGGGTTIAMNPWHGARTCEPGE